MKKNMQGWGGCLSLSSERKNTKKTWAEKY
jgi:hypothetical protein